MMVRELRAVGAGAGAKGGIGEAGGREKAAGDAPCARSAGAPDAYRCIKSGRGRVVSFSRLEFSSAGIFRATRGRQPSPPSTTTTPPLHRACSVTCWVASLLRRPPPSPCSWRRQRRLRRRLPLVRSRDVRVAVEAWRRMTPGGGARELEKEVGSFVLHRPECWVWRESAGCGAHGLIGARHPGPPYPSSPPPPSSFFQPPELLSVAVVPPCPAPAVLFT